MPAKPKPSEFEWPTGGGKYYSEAEKDAWIDSGTPFTVIGAAATENEEFGPRAEWTTDETVESHNEDGEVIEVNRVVAFARESVDSRDRVLDAMVHHFASGGAPIKCKMIRKGRVKLIVPAE